MTDQPKDRIDALLGALEKDGSGMMPGTTPHLDQAGAAYSDLLTGLSALAGDMPPPEGLFDKIEAGLDIEETAGVTTLRAESGTWKSCGNGVWQKTLSRSPDGTVVALVRCEPGAVIPSHHHKKPEHAVVIEGAFTMGTVTVRAGDSQYSAANTNHPELTSETGCLLLIVA